MANNIENKKSITVTNQKTNTKSEETLEKRFCSMSPKCTTAEEKVGKCGCKEDNVQFLQFWGVCFCYQLPPMIAMP